VRIARSSLRQHSFLVQDAVLKMFRTHTRASKKNIMLSARRHENDEISIGIKLAYYRRSSDVASRRRTL